MWFFNSFSKRLSALEAQAKTFDKEQKKMDASVTQLQTDLATLKTDVGTKVASLQSQIDALIANQGNLPADVVAALQQMDSDVKALDATVNPTT